METAIKLFASKLLVVIPELLTRGNHFRNGFIILAYFAGLVIIFLLGQGIGYKMGLKIFFNN
jgi:hypothetical protein